VVAEKGRHFTRARVRVSGIDEYLAAVIERFIYERRVSYRPHRFAKNTGPSGVAERKSPSPAANYGTVEQKWANKKKKKTGARDAENRRGRRTIARQRRTEEFRKRSAGRRFARDVRRRRFSFRVFDI